MILRPRQKVLAQAVLRALEERNNTLCVAPTGAGKTVMLSFVAKALAHKGKGPVLVIQHREEILEQNTATFRLVCPEASHGVVQGPRDGWDHPFVFGMIQTLEHRAHAHGLPFFGTCIIDEAHHTGARSYHAVLSALREKNPSMLLAGFTATPLRGDQKTLLPWFDNLADRISIKELVASGHLVIPKTKVIANVAQRRALLSEDANSNTGFVVPPEEVVRSWKEHASRCKSVFFAPDIAQSKALRQAFEDEGVPAWHVDHTMPYLERRDLMAEFSGSSGGAVLSNAILLTEGWDCPAVNCVGLTRNCGHKGLMIQIIGRGLRPHPDKEECLVLDFGTSAIVHGSLEEDLTGLFKDHRAEALAARKKEEEERERKVREQLEELAGFTMVDFDLLASRFLWVKVRGEGDPVVATSFECSAFVRAKRGRRRVFEAIGFFPKKGETKARAVLLMQGRLNLCMASADDFMSKNSTSNQALRGSAWMNKEPTTKQLDLIDRFMGYMDPPETAYQGACMISAFFARNVKVERP